METYTFSDGGGGQAAGAGAAGAVQIIKARAGRDFQLYVNMYKFFIVHAYIESLYILTYDCIMSKIF